MEWDEFVFVDRDGVPAIKLDPLENQRQNYDSPVMTDALLGQFCHWFETNLDSICAHNGIRRETAMWNVTLSNNQIGDAGVEKFMEMALRQNICCHILKLFKNRLTDAGAHSLSKLIQKTTHPIAELHLSHNKITQVGAVKIISVIHKHPSYPRRRGVHTVPIWLRLEYNQIQDVQRLVDFVRDKGVPICTESRRTICGPHKCGHQTSTYMPIAHLYVADGAERGSSSYNHPPQATTTASRAGGGTTAAGGTSAASAKPIPGLAPKGASTETTPNRSVPGSLNVSGVGGAKSSPAGAAGGSDQSQQRGGGTGGGGSVAASRSAGGVPSGPPSVASGSDGHPQAESKESVETKETSPNRGKKEEEEFPSLNGNGVDTCGNAKPSRPLAGGASQSPQPGGGTTASASGVPSLRPISSASRPVSTAQSSNTAITPESQPQQTSEGSPGHLANGHVNDTTTVRGTEATRGGRGSSSPLHELSALFAHIPPPEAPFPPPPKHSASLLLGIGMEAAKAKASREAKVALLRRQAAESGGGGGNPGAQRLSAEAEKVAATSAKIAESNGYGLGFGT